MKNDDFGFYGKGIDGYVHYRQAMDESNKSRPNAASPAHTASKPEPKPKTPMSGINKFLYISGGAVCIDLMLFGLDEEYIWVILFFVLGAAFIGGLIVKFIMVQRKKSDSRD
ncbi:MAG: hypothetical protein ACOYIE_08185 [Agathobaculum sp.]|uniref:hypothetical protein n=1 Tax=Agathobaculum sp. TaxID=2048138 RepID=UPI003D943609